MRKLSLDSVIYCSKKIEYKYSNMNKIKKIVYMEDQKCLIINHLGLCSDKYFFSA